MRFKEFTTTELEHRLAQLVAAQIERRLAGRKIWNNAVLQGLKHGRSRYVARLRPGREAQQREFRQRQRGRNQQRINWF